MVGSGGRVGRSGRVDGSDGRVGWLDKLGIRLNSAPTEVEVGWKLGLSLAKSFLR